MEDLCEHNARTFNAWKFFNILYGGPYVIFKGKFSLTLHLS